jgi:hypothetical protein
VVEVYVVPLPWIQPSGTAVAPATVPTHEDSTTSQ